MKSKMLFRDGGNVIRTRGDSPWWWVACAFLAVAMAWVYVAWRDDTAEHQEAALEARLLATYEAGLRQGRAEIMASVKGGWQAGLDEGQLRCTARQP